MKNFKNIISIILSVIIIVCCLPISSLSVIAGGALSGDLDGPFKWAYDEETAKLTITNTVENGTGEMKLSDTKEIGQGEAPWYEYRDEITAVSLPDGLTTIGHFAFEGCTKLTEIEIPDTVKTIKHNAFTGCTSLKSLVVPKSVTAIDVKAFENCNSLETVTLENSPISISDNAFLGVTNIKVVLFKGSETDRESKVTGYKYINDGVTPDWFYNYDEAKIKGNYSKNLEYSLDPLTETLTFTGSGSMYDYSVASDVPYVLYKDHIKKIVFKGKVTNIGENAFSRCKKLKSVEVPEGVTAINRMAFSYCDALEKIKFPLSLTTINESAFYLSNNIKEITYAGSIESSENISIIGINNDFLKNKNWKFENKDKALSYIRPSKAFPDVVKNSWYESAVDFVYRTGLFSGYENGKFGPSDKIQRQDFILVLAKYDGVDLKEYNGVTFFPDVPSDSYYAAAVQWASENNISSGYENGDFGVGDPITREQLICFLYKYAQNSNYVIKTTKTKGDIFNMYPDFKNVSDWAEDAVVWAVENKIISGKNGTKIAPHDNCTRCEAAQIFRKIDSEALFYTK